MIKKSKKIRIVDDTSKTKEDKIIIISKVKYLYDYVLEIHFDDDVVQNVNFAPFLISSPHPEVKKYLNVLLFKDYTLDNGQLYWNDYDLIFPIIELYTNDIKSYTLPTLPFKKSVETLINDFAKILKEDSSIPIGDLLPAKSNFSFDDFMKKPIMNFLEELVSTNNEKTNRKSK
ncbi:MAG: DUF2442 domain-containing protein [Chitinophagales bacterium]